MGGKNVTESQMINLLYLLHFLAGLSSFKISWEQLLNSSTEYSTETNVFL